MVHGCVIGVRVRPITVYKAVDIHTFAVLQYILDVFE